MANHSEPRLVSQEDKRQLTIRLARIEGQIRGIQQMIEREAGCEMVAQQLAAARSALNKAFLDLIARTLEKNCLADSTDAGQVRDRVSTLLGILTKYA